MQTTVYKVGNDVVKTATTVYEVVVSYWNDEAYTYGYHSVGLFKTRKLATEKMVAMGTIKDENGDFILPHGSDDGFDDGSEIWIEERELIG